MDRNAKELREQALRKLAEYYPEEKKVYDQWEDYIEIYAAGFKIAPHVMNEILEPFRSDDPHIRGYYYGQLGVCLNIANMAIRRGYCPEWLVSVIKVVDNFESYVMVRLIWECGAPIWRNRLDTACEDYLHRESEHDDDYYIGVYGISEDRLRSWKLMDKENKNLPLELPAFSNVPDLRAGALEFLSHHLAEEQKKYNTVSDGLDFFEAGYYAALDKCVKLWLRKNNKKFIIDHLRNLNEMFKEKSSVDEIREKISGDLTSEVQDVFNVLIKCYEDNLDAEKRKNRLE